MIEEEKRVCSDLKKKEKNSLGQIGMLWWKYPWDFNEMWVPSIFLFKMKIKNEMVISSKN